MARAPVVTRFLAAWSMSGWVQRPGVGWFIQPTVMFGNSCHRRSFTAW